MLPRNTGIVLAALLLLAGLLGLRWQVRATEPHPGSVQPPAAPPPGPPPHRLPPPADQPPPRYPAGSIWFDAPAEVPVGEEFEIRVVAETGDRILTGYRLALTTTQPLGVRVIGAGPAWTGGMRWGPGFPQPDRQGGWQAGPTFYFAHKVSDEAWAREDPADWPSGTIHLLTFSMRVDDPAAQGSFMLQPVPPYQLPGLPPRQELRACSTEDPSTHEPLPDVQVIPCRIRIRPSAEADD
jgi:hypothetical protein